MFINCTLKIKKVSCENFSKSLTFSPKFYKKSKHYELNFFPLCKKEQLSNLFLLFTSSLEPNIRFCLWSLNIQSRRSTRGKGERKKAKRRDRGGRTEGSYYALTSCPLVLRAGISARLSFKLN